MKILWAEQALTADGWAKSVRIEINEDGKIAALMPDQPVNGTRLSLALPAPSNLHSHAFQRAMAGLTEARGASATDSFWTWRKLMFAFLDQLTPDDVQAISALVQMEMLEAGYAAVGEFHYLHHAPGGAQYDDIAEMSDRIFAAQQTSGIGLTHLPVLYTHGGCDGRALISGQVRFQNDFNMFHKLFDVNNMRISQLSRDCSIGVAPHSLRAVRREDIAAIAALHPDGPVHMHVAEQRAEVEEVEEAWGARPVEWLLKNHDVDERWCLIHATQMTPDETHALARSGAIAGLCPITESSLGDGIFDGVRYLANGGRFGIGSDSNVRIALSEELRTLEYSQRLRDRSRAALATAEASCGRVLFEVAAAGSAQALGRASGALEVGKWADILEIDATHADLEGLTGDTLLDTWVFAGDDRMVRNVWSAGRHMVQDGRHTQHATIVEQYRKTMRKLRSAL